MWPRLAQSPVLLAPPPLADYRGCRCLLWPLVNGNSGKTSSPQRAELVLWLQLASRGQLGC